MKSLWHQGSMPVELLLVLTGSLLIFLAVHFITVRQFHRNLSPLWQSLNVVLAAYVIFKFVIYPPLPSTLLNTYMGLTAISVALYVSSREQSWFELKSSLLHILSGDTRWDRTVRAVSFTLFAGLAGWGTYDYLRPVYQEPIEMRFNHPAPPAEIEVHGKKFNLQKSRSPFRVDEKGNYSEGIQYKYRNANLFEN